MFPVSAQHVCREMLGHKSHFARCRARAVNNEVSLDLRLCGMVMEVNSDQVSFGAGAACLGNPLHALGWLAKTMADKGAPLKEGDVVLSGALGPMVGVSGGDYVEARIEGLGAVRVSIAAD